MTKMKLKPCPFCGGKADTNEKYYLSYDAWLVYCIRCNCSTTKFTGDTDEDYNTRKAQGKELAISAWNKRTPTKGIKG